MNYWLGLAKADVASLGYQIIDSSGPYATSYSFFDTMLTHKPDLIIADGHGDPNTLTGQGLESVLRSCYNNDVLSGKVMCALSCLTGQNLGPDSRNKSARAYMGFVNEFTWMVSPPYNPASDPVALSFQEVVRKLVYLTAKYQLEEASLKEVYNGVRDEFIYWRNYYGVPPGSDDPYARDILLSLNHDQNGLITLGEEALGPEVYPVQLLSPVAPIAVGLGAILLPMLVL